LNEADALDIVRSALWTVIVASGPPVVAAMVVGIVIAFFQALTQIQEMTLTFIPKMLAVFGMLIATGPFIGGQLLIFSQEAYSRVEVGFNRGPGTGQVGGRNADKALFELRPGFKQSPESSSAPE
jgi:flagellar biosynthetic protein FliQ